MKDKEKKVNQSSNQYGKAVGFTKQNVDLGAGELIEFFCNSDEKLNIDEDLGVNHGQEDEGGMGDHRTCRGENYYDGGEVDGDGTRGRDFEYD